MAGKAERQRRSALPASKEAYILLPVVFRYPSLRVTKGSSNFLLRLAGEQRISARDQHISG